MIIDAISDLHGETPKLPGGDLLIVAGDSLAGDSLLGRIRFFVWLAHQPYKERVYISGNHDHSFARQNPDYAPEGTYLEDSSTVHNGLHIYGTPWTPWFDGVPKHADAFMCKERDLQEKFAQIPADDCDILVTHAPPHGILDKVYKTFYGSNHHKGSLMLLNATTRVKPWIHFFGHIHEGFGFEIRSDVLYCNCSFMDEDCVPRNKIIRVRTEIRDKHRAATPEVLDL